MRTGQGDRKSSLLNAGLVLLLGVTGLLGIQLVDTLRERQRMAFDLAEVKDVKYGLLNADVWIAQVSAIVEKRVSDFRMTPENRRAIKPILERGLDTFITEADTYMRAQNDARGLAGHLKQGVQDIFVDPAKVKAGIPRYADRILDEMDKPESRRQIAGLLENLLSDVKQSSFAVVDRRPLEALRVRYDCSDNASCQQAISGRIESSHLHAVWLASVIVALAALLFAAVWLAPGRNDRTRMGLLVLCSTLLMLCGVLTPMMEVEARISELRFVLLSQPVVFADQVLYFKSKSVLDVAQTLLSNAEMDIKLVGVLVLTFGVIFPVLKLAASFVYLYDLKGLRRIALVRFFALKSGKWSMADVFVISILMAYIGFDAMISNQLSRIAESGSRNVHILTTNGTSLQTGFFMFLAFCLASLVASSMIESRLRDAKLDENSMPR